MRDYYAFRHTAIRYWERRRILYNLALVPPAFLGYMVSAAVAHAGDPHESYVAYVLALFALAALGANVCYSFAYALEFFFGSDDPTSRWLRYGRTSFFIAGVLFAMLLSLIGGRDIALSEFYRQFNRAA